MKLRAAITKISKNNSRICANAPCKLVKNDQNCTRLNSKTVYSFDRLCRSCVVEENAFTQIQPQIRRKSLKSDENFFGCTCFVVLNFSLTSPISQCHRPVVTGVTWGWTTLLEDHIISSHIFILIAILATSVAGSWNNSIKNDSHPVRFHAKKYYYEMKLLDSPYHSPKLRYVK
jgi:hypothetical protein